MLVILLSTPHSGQGFFKPSAHDGIFGLIFNLYAAFLAIDGLPAESVNNLRRSIRRT
jgi:hypothetical protein